MRKIFLIYFLFFFIQPIYGDTLGKNITLKAPIDEQVAELDLLLEQIVWALQGRREVVVLSSENLSLRGYIEFEGATNDDYETILNVVDPTGDRTILLPDLSGTLSVFGASLDDTELTAEDFGDFTSTGLEDGCTLNTGVVGDNEIDYTEVNMDDMVDGTTNAAITLAQETNFETGYTHSQDNTQAHSDYLINNGDDTTTGDITANGFIGNLTGNVTGNLTGDVTGNVSGSSGSCTGNAATATALAVNGANAAAGQAILGVDASGAAEGAFDVWTEAENTAAGYISATLTQEESEDYAGEMVANATGTHTRITLTYQDATGDMDIVVDDMNDDVPEAGDFGAATDLDANGALVANAVDSAEYTDASIDHEHLSPDIISGLTDVTSADADYIMIHDATDNTLKKCDMGEVRGSGGGGGGSGPSFIYGLEYDSIGQGTWGFISGNYGWGYGFFYNTSSNNGDNISYKMYLSAGTYTCKMIHYRNTNKGIVDIYIGATEKASFDLYGVGGGNIVMTQTNISVSSSGVKTIKLQVDGKNASSTNYIISWNYVVFYRTN